MRVKAYLEVDRDEYINSCLFATTVRINMARRNYAFYRKTLFPGEKAIPFNQEIVFARLYEKIGRDNYAVRALKTLRSEYLQEVRQIWADYYNTVCRLNASSDIAVRAENQMRSYQFCVHDIECALSFFEKQHKRTFLKWPKEISEFVTAIQSNNFAEFYRLCKKHRMNWHNISAYGKRKHEMVAHFQKAKSK